MLSLRRIMPGVDDCVRPRKEQAFVPGVPPSHEIRRIATRPAHLEDFAVSKHLTGPVSTNCDSIANVCVHEYSSLLCFDYSAAGFPQLGAEVPCVRAPIERASRELDTGRERWPRRIGQVPHDSNDDGVLRIP